MKGRTAAGTDQDSVRTGASPLPDNVLDIGKTVLCNTAMGLRAALRLALSL